jgi:hypothetical protein
MDRFGISKQSYMLSFNDKNCPLLKTVGAGFILLVFFVWLYSVIANWPSYDAPYKQICCYYDYTLVNFFTGLANTFMYFLYNDLTSYTNLNIVIGVPAAIIGSFVYICIAAILLVIVPTIIICMTINISRILLKMPPSAKYSLENTMETYLVPVLLTALVFPAIFAGIWAIFAWLFA